MSFASESQRSRTGYGSNGICGLAVARDALEKFLAFFRRLDADAEDLHLSFKISFPLVDKGRHLGPAPGSPAAAVKEHHRRRRILEDCGEVCVSAIDIFEACGWENITDG